MFSNEEWKKHKNEMELMKKKRRGQFYEVIKEFERLGFSVQTLSPYQYRFNECLDVYPSNRKYHDLKNNKRGDIRDQTCLSFIRRHFGLIDASEITAKSYGVIKIKGNVSAGKV